jgi:UDP-N-acetylmuramoyl-tripeptide--D-alanyl-D-alanine ligase
MGMNHFGEIDYLTKLIRPTVAIINNAAAAHLEGLESIAGVARAKGEIFAGLSDDGIAILNKNDSHFSYWQNLVGQKRTLAFGLNIDADVTATIVAPQLICLQTYAGEITVKLNLLGQHNIMNALAATAATLALGIDLKTIKQGLESVAPAPGRMRQHILASGTCLIDDTYNANPFSLQAAISSLAEMTGTKILVLGDMKELGASAEQLHFNAGQQIKAANIDHLFTLGALTAATARGFGKNARHFTDRQELLAALKPLLQSQTNILIKGSRSMSMEKIVAGILPAEQFDHAH